MRPTIGHPYHRVPKIDLLPLVASLVDFLALGHPRRLRYFYCRTAVSTTCNNILCLKSTDKNESHQARVYRDGIAKLLTAAFVIIIIIITSIVCRVFGDGDGSRLPGPTPDVDVSTRSAYVPFSPTPTSPPPPLPPPPPLLIQLVQLLERLRSAACKISSPEIEDVYVCVCMRTRLPDRC